MGDVNHWSRAGPGGPLPVGQRGVQSKDVAGVINGYYTTHDLSYTSIK